MFLHARKCHVELPGKGCDRSVRTPELLQNAAASGVRERAERGIEVGLAILSHLVQYTKMPEAMLQGRWHRCIDNMRCVETREKGAEGSRSGRGSGGTATGGGMRVTCRWFRCA